MNAQNRLPFFILSLCTFILCANEQYSHISNDQITVIFDMGGVLLNIRSLARLIELRKLITYGLTHNPLKIKKALKKKLFALLDGLEERDQNEVDAHDEEGNLVPQIICNWLKGKYSSEQLRNALDAALASQPKNIETSILRDIAHIIFTPEKFSEIQYLVPETMAFVQELKEKGYKIYILSNFCSETFNLIKNKHVDFFALFDGIIISGDVGLIKPDPQIYTYLLTAYNIDAAKAFFIDDQPVNVQAAQKMGIPSIVCSSKRGWYSGGHPDIQAVKKKFSLWRESVLTSGSAKVNLNPPPEEVA